MAARYALPQVYGEGADLIDDKPVDTVVLAFPAAGRYAMGHLDRCVRCTVAPSVPSDRHRCGAYAPISTVARSGPLDDGLHQAIQR